MKKRFFFFFQKDYSPSRKNKHIGSWKHDLTLSILIITCVDGIDVFHGTRTKVVKQFQSLWNPRLVGIHCMGGFEPIVHFVEVNQFLFLSMLWTNMS